ncbi:hypothetical protein Dpep_1207 [Dethiosulfovibrio peptidovorans DSM 11002]|uniref:Receptor ligand binding region domain-containing protein n=1 Tax=Dethiosulfovibrio peptidovorans DSM 11002 TaxID=469381 RepID=D2Z6Y6_9BACT|nr:hypothetical protein [Dethiosulfovibrio peptidovorans]EFC91233.1 hypothetical protein Dpep_1207 [Dethiosulfovibrio peptidovorans DSM 11002]
MKKGLWISIAGVVAILGILFYKLSTPVVIVGVAVNEEVAFSAPEGAMLSVIKSYVLWHNSSRGDSYRLQVEVATFGDDVAEAVKELSRRGAAVVVGFPLSWEAIAAAEAAERLEIPVISPSASSSAMSGRDDWFFRMITDADREVKALARLMSFLNLEGPIVYRSPYNDAYVNSLLEDMRRLSDSIPSGVVVYPEMAGDSLSGDGVVIIAEPSRSYWILQDVLLHYPPVPIFLSRWSQVSDFRYFFDIVGAEFYFSSVYDPTSIPEDDFLRFLLDEREVDMGVFSRYTVAAMKYLSSVFDENPKARGEELRSMLARPRTVDGPGWTFKLNRYGDVESEIRVYRFKNGSVEEVILP